jgi:hypothetical protein
MSSTTKTFTFASSQEGWAGTPASTMVIMGHNASTGSPGDGCLTASLSSKNENPGVSYWEWFDTWEALGVPAGSTVTEIGTSNINDYNWRCSQYVSGHAGNNFTGEFSIYSSGSTLMGNFSTELAAISSTTPWATQNGQAITVPSGQRSSTSKIRLRAEVGLRTGNSNSAVVTILLDQIALKMTYTTAGGGPSDINEWYSSYQYHRRA